MATETKAEIRGLQGSRRGGMVTLPHPGWGGGCSSHEPQPPSPRALRPQAGSAPKSRLTATLGISHTREVHPAVPATQEDSPQLSPGLSQTWPQEEVVPGSRNGSREAL